MGIICTYILWPVNTVKVGLEPIYVGVRGNNFVNLWTGQVLCPSTTKGNNVVVNGHTYRVH